MADSIIRSVKSFNTDYKEAQENLDRFIKKFQDKINEERTCAERCNYWLKFSAAVSSATAAMEEEGADREKILQEIEALEIPESEATPEREKELRNQAVEAIRNSGVMLGALVEQAKALEEMETADAAAGMLIDLGAKETAYRAIAAMLAYTKIKNGEFDNIPVEMTAAQVTALVCAEIEQTKIMEAVGKGDLAVDIAAGLLSILGIVVLITIAVKVAVAGAAMITAVFGTILAIPAGLMLIAGILRAMFKAADFWKEDSRRIVNGVSAAIQFVIKGLRMVVSYVTDHIIPKAVEACRDIKDKVKNICNSQRMETQVDAD